MSESTPPGTLARLFLLTLVVVATLAFLWLIAPFSSAILWAVFAAVLFDPLNTRLLRAMPNHRNSVALATLLVIISIALLATVELLRRRSDRLRGVTGV